MSARLVTPPVGSAVFLANTTSPERVGYVGTWERRHIVLYNLNAQKPLDVYGTSTKDGANVVVWTANQSKAQSWWFGMVKADTTTEAGALDLWVRTA